MNTQAELQVPLVDLPLDKNDGIRVILGPLKTAGTTEVTPSSSVSYVDIEKRSNDLDSKTTVTLIAQSFLDIKSSLVIRLKQDNRDLQILCDLYYESTSDNVILRNQSFTTIEIHNSIPHLKYECPQVLPKATKVLSPGVYSLNIYKAHLLDLRILPRLHTQRISGTDLSKRNSPSMKRGLDAEDHLANSQTGPIQQIRKLGHNKETSALFLTTTVGALPDNGNPFIDLCRHGVLNIPGAADVEGYSLHKRGTISKTNQSEVYLAQHSGIGDKDVVVKVMKIQDKRSVVDHAEDWLREYRVHSELKHESIVAMYGVDARYLAFFLEHIPDADLTKIGVWRNDTNHYFCGSEQNAFQVGVEISSAIQYLHSLDFVHHDIKPANILLSGRAVLCDFGVSCRSSKNISNGGTPFYIPPEYITGQRSKPGDVFAFGITLLYLSKRLPLPDSTQGEDAYFIIADIHSKKREVQEAARDKMTPWLKQVEAARARLDVSNTFELIIWDMLNPRSWSRPDAAELVKRFKIEQYERDYRPRAKDKTFRPAADDVHTVQTLSSAGSTQKNDSIEWIPRSPSM